MLGHPSLVYSLSGRLFYEAGNLKDCFTYIGSLFVTLICVMQNVWQTLSCSRNPEGLSNLLLSSLVVISLWVLHVQFIQHTIKQFRQYQFHAQMASLVTLNANSIMSFFNAH